MWLLTELENRKNESVKTGKITSVLTLGHIRQAAEREGIPYQTFITSILHKYVTGQLVAEDDLKKAAYILRETEAKYKGK